MRAGYALHHLVVRSRNAGSSHGHLEVGSLQIPCALGRSGVSYRKREGDGATPAGVWPIRQVMLRRDRVPVSLRAPALGGRPLRPDDGWGDAPGDRNYNRRVRHPYAASAERLWRVDRLYDVIVVLGHNDRPRVRGRGSAIFLHVARENLAPTEGCIAVRKRDLLRLLPALSRRTVVRVLR